MPLVTSHFKNFRAEVLTTNAYSHSFATKYPEKWKEIELKFNQFSSMLRELDDEVESYRETIRG